MSKDDLVLNIAGGGPPRDPVKEVIGRDSFVNDLKKRLAYTSVEMYAPRRLGKSWVLRLLEVKAGPEKVAIYFDLERHHSLYEFVVALAKVENSSLTKIKVAMGKIMETLVVKGTKMENYNFPWKDRLDEIFKEMNNLDTPVWLLLDEFPIMINNLITDKKESEAKEFLDYMRFARQNYSNIKFVLTGSIGLHWIIDRLEKTGWRNPQNDVEKITLTSLSHEDATRLAEGILRGQKEDPQPGKDLAQVTSGHPFYIQKAITRWSDRKTNEDMESFCDRIAQSIEDPFEFNDLDKHMGHYFRRNTPLAKRVTDVLAGESAVLPKEVVQRLSDDPENIINILRKLEMDGYTQSDNGKYHLYPPLFRRWWKNKREGLYE